MKIGDRVKIDRLEASSNQGEIPFFWYSDEIYTIMDIFNNVATLDRNLKNADNTIHISYLKLLSEERKNKLLNLGKL